MYGSSIFSRHNKIQNNRHPSIIKDTKIEKVNDINFNPDEKKKKKTNKIIIDKEPDIDFSDLTISKVETNKNNICQRFLMEQNIIPKHPGVSIYVGSINSGKTTLINNFLSKPQYYGKSKECNKNNNVTPYFDVTFLLTGSDDDMYDVLIDNGLIDEEHIKYDPQPEDIQYILDVQGETVKEKGLLKSPRILIILEDVVDNKKLLNSAPFRSLFIKPRQNNISVWMLAQYVNLIPKSLRQQAINLFIFSQNRAGEEVIADQYCPAHMKKTQFLRMIQQATSARPGDTHPFLHINRRAKPDERFRRNLNKIIKV